MITAEQMIEAQKTQLETLVGLTTKAFEGVEKLMELNMQLAKATMGEATETAKTLLAAKDAQEMLALQASLVQPAAEKAMAYSRHVYDITTTTSAEVGKVAETRMAEVQQKMLQAVDAVAKNAPAGSENAVTLMKSAVAAASNAYESVQKAAKQAADVSQTNLQAFTANATNATQAAVSAVKARRPATVA
jgi:phasin family protein